MLMKNFQISRPVGTGHSRPNDVVRLRKALRETGHGSSPPDPSGVYDSSLNGTIKRFQGDYGLEQDGVVMPDGPTARMLDLALTAQRQSGDDGQAQLRDTIGAIGNAGLKPQAPPPGDKRPIVFADANGRIATPDEVVGLIGRSLNRSTDRRDGTAPGTTGAAAATAGAATADGMTAGGSLAGESALGETIAAIAPAALPVIASLAGGTVVGSISYAADQWGKTHPDYVARMQSERDAVAASIADRNARQRARRDANGARRTINTEANPSTPPGTPPDLPSHIPTPPFTHPPVPRDDDPENVPIVENSPQILKGAKVNPAKPEIMIREALPDDEFWKQLSILYSRPGGPETREGNHALGETGVEAGQEIGEEVEFTHGGYNTERIYRSELHLKPAKQLQVPGKPTKNGSFLDVVLKHKGTGRRLLINTQSVDSAGNPTKDERRQVDKVLLNKETGDIFWGVPKPPRGADPKKWAQQYKERLKELIREISKPL